MLPGDDIVTQFQQLQQIWYAPLWNIASDLFMLLATIEVGLSALLWVVQQQGAESIGAGLLRKFLWLGLMYAILLKADLWIPAVIQSFAIAGQHAAHVERLAPGEVFTMGLGVGLKMLGLLTTWGNLVNPAGLTLGIFCVLLVIGSFAVIAVQMAVTLIKAYILTGAGVLLLGFAAFRGTSSIAERYLSFTVGIGLQLLTLYLIVGAGSVLAVQWAQLINDTNAWDFKVHCTIAFAAVMFATVAMSIPKLAGAMASGSISMGFSDVLGTAYMASRVTSMAQSAGSTFGIKGLGSAMSVGNATRSSIGAGRGESIPQGAVPKLNSAPAGSKATP